MLELMQGDSEGLKREHAWQGQLKKGTGQCGLMWREEKNSKKEQAKAEQLKKEQAKIQN